jgi:hypothetical protein
MSSAFNQDPPIPDEVANAAASGELVVFVGAGISRLINCPSWDQFADRVLDQLAPTCLDYYEISQIKTILDPKKRLSIAQIVAVKNNKSIDYKSIFSVKLADPNVYTHLNSFNSAFVTTNYDKYLAPFSRAAEPEDQWRFFRRDHILRANIDRNGNIVHLHGCVDDPATMIVTTKQYLEHYSRPEVQEFLRYLFDSKTVLFLGYGLDELEVLEYILRRGGVMDAQTASSRIRRYALLGFFNPEISFFGLLREYYRESFETELIGYPKDFQHFAQQTDILASWERKLKFAGVTLADEAALLENEIRG